MSYILLHDIKKIETKFCDQPLDNNVIPIEKKQLYTVFAMCEAENDRFEHIEYLSKSLSKSNCIIYNDYPYKYISDSKTENYLDDYLSCIKVIIFEI